MEDHHDAHEVARVTRQAQLEAEAQGKIMAALEGMNSDQCRRVLNATAALNDLEVRIPVPKL